MNYTDDEKQEHLRELKNYLNTVSYYEPNVPYTGADGKITEAAAAFQRGHGLPETGMVDERTWNEIYRVYREVSEYLGKPAAVDVFPESPSVLDKGYSGAAAAVLGIMLNFLADRYANIPRSRTDGVYGDDTREAVKVIQSALGMSPDGRTDILVWNRIAELFSFENGG